MVSMRRRVKVARIAKRRAFRKAKRLPKRVLAKKWANTVGQIAFRRGKARPSHSRKFRRGRRMRRMRRRRY